MSQMPGTFPPNTMAPPPKKSNTMLWVLLGIGGVLLCGCGGCIGVPLILGVMYGQPFIVAGTEVAKVPMNATVQEKLGTNIKADNEGEPIFDSNHLVMNLRISGEKGSAKGRIEVTNEGGSWKAKSHTIEFTDGSVLDVLTNQVSQGANNAPPEPEMEPENEN